MPSILLRLLSCDRSDTLDTTNSRGGMACECVCVGDTTALPVDTLDSAPIDLLLIGRILESSASWLDECEESWEWVRGLLSGG